MRGGRLLSDIIYPIGSIYISTVPTNPSEWFGGVWEAFATGRTLVGIDTSQTEFNTVMKTGGSKYLQKHTHTQNPHYHNFRTNEYNPVSVLYDSGSNQWYGVGAFGGYLFSAKTLGITEATAVNNSTGAGDSQNLQPYIVVYMWKRIS